MIAGIVLMALGGLVATLWIMSPSTDFHLFAALNLMVLGAICCTLAHYLGEIQTLLRDRTKQNAGPWGGGS